MHARILPFLAALALVALAAPAQGATLVLAPIGDTTAYSFEPDTNFGAIPALAGGGVFNGSQQWVTFLQFGLSAIAEGEVVTGATLNLFQFLGGGFAPIGASVYRVADDAWSEGTLTWNDSPIVFGVDLNDTTRIGANDNAGTTYRGWSQWDLLANGHWDPALDVADGVLSIAVYSNAYLGTQTHNWCSRESDLTNCLVSGETAPVAALRRPYLELTVVPLPASVWLVAPAFGMLAPWLRLRRRG